MAKGMRLPVETNPRGGAKTLEGSDLLRQNIKLGLMPASSMNPWNQKLTPRADTNFSVLDAGTGVQFIGHVQRFFEELQQVGLARLPPDQPPFVVVSNADKGELEVVITYIDLEDAKSREIRFGGRR